MCVLEQAIMCVQPISSHSEVCADPQLKTSENEKKKTIDVGEPKAPYFFYRNFSDLPDPDPSKPITAPGRIPNFPAKMMAILSRPDLADIICWMPHGRSWKVLKPREFEVKVIPTYFEHAKFSSFIRQANGWGFRRIVSKGPDRNSYYHEMFLRGKSHLIKMMKRPTTTGRPQADPNTEPDFYRIAQEHPLPEANPDDDHSLQERASRGTLNQNGHHNQGSTVSYQPHPVSPPHDRSSNGQYTVDRHKAISYDSRPLYYHTHSHLASHPAPPVPTMMAPQTTPPLVARALTPIESHEPTVPPHTHSFQYTARAVSPVSSSSYDMSHSYYHVVEPYPVYSAPAVNHWTETCNEPQEMPYDFEDPFAGGLTPVDFW